jgi:hypothetical protein
MNLTSAEKEKSRVQCIIGTMQLQLATITGQTVLPSHQLQ